MQSQADEDAARWGVQRAAPTRPRQFEVWEEHWKALEVFLACRTQWRVIAGMGGAQHQGLDYGALESVMRMMGVEDAAATLAQVQRLEAGALEVLNG